MSKEYLEALNGLFDLVHCQDSFEKAQKYFDIIEEALKRLESIDNANSSEALECLEKLELLTCDFEWYKDNINTIKQALIKAEKEHKALDLLMQELDCKDFAELRKYARCGYERLNNKYLKWEDLEFKEEEQWLKVKMGDNFYRIEWCNDDFGANVVSFYKYITKDYLVYCACIKENGKQFFNDLHLERVEE